MAKSEPMRLREPKHDCILYRNNGISKYGSCGGLNELYCTTELMACPFYKSKDKYDAAGKPLERGKR